MSFHHLFLDRTNIFGSVATGVSAASASVQSDHFQQTTLFVVSFVVGVLTAVHLGLQIRHIVKAILKEKRK